MGWMAKARVINSREIGPPAPPKFNLMKISIIVSIAFVLLLLLYQSVLSVLLLGGYFIYCIVGFFKGLIKEMYKIG
jgi:hypothetical protein